MRRKFNNIAAAILAGGKNSRMQGKNKAFIRINGLLIIKRTITLLKGIFEEVIIVTNYPKDYELYSKETVIAQDFIKDIGPLGGIHTALSVTSKQAVFFVACDMPFLHNALIRQEAAIFNKTDCDCLVPRIGHVIEPLHAVYKKSIRGDIHNFVKKNSDYSIRGFLQEADVFYWDINESRFKKDIFKNINTSDDLAKLKGSL